MVEMEEEAEYEDVVRIQFGRELTKDEKNAIAEYVESFPSVLPSIEWSKEQTN